MCKPASFVYRAFDGKVFWSVNGDSHELIIKENNLIERNCRNEILIVRTEIVPPNNRFSEPLEDWEFSVDQDLLPENYESSVVEAACRKALPCWYRANVVFGGESREVRDYAIVCDGSTVRAYDESTVKDYDSSTVDAYDKSSVWAYAGSTVNAYDESDVWAYGKSTVEAYDESFVCAYDYSTVKAYGKSTVEAGNGSIVEAYGGSTVKAYGGSIVKAYGGSSVWAYGGSLVKAYGGSFVKAYDDSTVKDYGGSIVDAFIGLTVEDHRDEQENSIERGTQ